MYLEIVQTEFDNENNWSGSGSLSITEFSSYLSEINDRNLTTIAVLFDLVALNFLRYLFRFDLKLDHVIYKSS